MTELKSRGAPDQGEPRGCITKQSTQGSSGQKARADATLGGTLSTGSHTGIFLRKAEISGWQQRFF